MSFLPEDYKEPSSVSNYLNMTEEGDYTIRILSDPIMGYEYWKTVDKKRTPVRKRLDEKVNTDELEVNPRSGELEIPKFFWAVKIYNYDLDKVQVFEIKQAKIRKPIEAYLRNKKWGDPKNYDLTITRTGKGFSDTDYNVTPNPPIEALNAELQEKCDNVKVNLEALYSGDDPFKVNEVDIEEVDL